MREKGRGKGNSISSARFPGCFTAAPPDKRGFDTLEEDEMKEVHGERNVLRYGPVKMRFTRVWVQGETL